MLKKRQKEVLDFIKGYSSKKGYSPSLEEIQQHFKLASVSTAHFHVKNLKNAGYLTKEDNQPRSISTFQESEMVQIPLLGIVSAGKPIEAIENKETMAVPREKLHGAKNIFGLTVSGNSMIDENINDGDVIILKEQSVPNNGDKVVALVNNNETTLKTFYREKNRIRLQPANKNMEPLIFRNNQDIQIQGVVIDVIQKKQDVKINLPFYKEQTKYQKLPLNKIIHGDAVEVMSRIPDSSIDLTVTSPPYDELRDYRGYNFDFEGIARNLFRITKKGGVLVWVVGDKIKKGNRSLTSFRQAIFFQEIGFNVHDVMIYRKKNTPFMRTNAYTNCFEFMFVLSKNSPKTFRPLKTRTVRQGQEMLPFGKGPDGINKKILGELKSEKTMTNIWEYAVGLYGTTSDKIAFKHPAVFPEKLAEDHILSWTNKKDVVFDPMCGSGTTCKMAAKNDRHYIGCDISREYVKLANRRMKMLEL